jgi:hypothetical protein
LPGFDTGSGMCQFGTYPEHREAGVEPYMSTCRIGSK